MEEMLENQEPEVQEIPEAEVQEEQPRYQPRPAWQIAMAWIGVAVMVTLIALYYYNIATGGRR